MSLLLANSEGFRLLDLSGGRHQEGMDDIGCFENLLTRQ